MESIDRLKKYVDDNTDKTVALTTYPEQYGVHCTTVINDLIDAIEREVEERYIEGPTDKDGEPIRVGDVLQCERAHGGWCEPFEVHQLYIGPNGWAACKESGYGHIARLCRHNLTTVEDVLGKALNKAASLDRPEGYWPSAADITNILNEVAPKLQLREED